MLIFARDVFVVNANDANARAVVNIAAMNRIDRGVCACAARRRATRRSIDPRGERDTRDRARDRGVITRPSYTHTDRPTSDRPSERASARASERAIDVATSGRHLSLSQ